MTGPAYIYGMHDPGGQHLMADAPGTIVYTFNVGEDAPLDFRVQADQGFRALVRLNHSHNGNGTIPPDPSHWSRFASQCADFVARCQGVRDFTLGNEPNLKVEWGRDEPVTPEQYAECYRMVYRAIKQRTPSAQLSPAAVGPWNVESGLDWITYWRRMIAAIGDAVDFWCIHTYAREYSLHSITDRAHMEPPHQRYFNGFQSYRDFLSAIPVNRRDLPVDIKECNGNRPWPNVNGGFVQEAYAEIDRYNREPGAMRIRSLCMFRWPRFDVQWEFETKPGVHEDFRAAVARRYRAPQIDNAPIQPLSPPAVPIAPVSGERPAQWDGRLTQRGAQYIRADARPGETVYRLAEARWMDEQESGGRHHVFVDVRDESNRRMSAVQVVRYWPGHDERKNTDTGKADWHGADFPMFNRAPAYGVRVDGVSDRVEGLGLGSIAAPHHNIHTSYALVYRRTTEPTTQPQPTPPPPTVPRLVHPVADPAHRRITQIFGVNPERYARFNLDGHNGVDYATPVGSRIVAAADGVVVEVLDDTEGYGKYVKLRHDWGETLYAHLSQQLVAQGASVRAGEIIGAAGNTGNSTGPHLHFGLRVNPYARGRPFDGYSDPLPYLQQTHVTPPATEDIPTILRAAAREFGLDEALLLSLAWAESSFNPRAVSNVGAQGLCQIMPATWAEWSTRVQAADPFDPRDNARVGAAYLDWCIRQAGGVHRGLVAYNWGIGSLLAGGTPPAETIEFANKVIHGRDLLKAVGA